MPSFTKRHGLVVLLGLASALALVIVGRWLNATKRGGQGSAEPFRIAGDLYYVGATDASAFLITGPEGHIVLDGGYPTTAPMIIASIAKLGFSIRDVKVLLNSEPHPDHAGGLGVLQQASSAELWASEASAYTRVRSTLAQSGALEFSPPSDDEVSRIVSKAVAGAHEVVRPQTITGRGCRGHRVGHDAAVRLTSGQDHE